MIKSQHDIIADHIVAWGRIHNYLSTLGGSGQKVEILPAIFAYVDALQKAMVEQKNIDWENDSRECNLLFPELFYWVTLLSYLREDNTTQLECAEKPDAELSIVYNGVDKAIAITVRPAEFGERLRSALDLHSSKLTKAICATTHNEARAVISAFH